MDHCSAGRWKWSKSFFPTENPSMLANNRECRGVSSLGRAGIEHIAKQAISEGFSTSGAHDGAPSCAPLVEKPSEMACFAMCSIPALPSEETPRHSRLFASIEGFSVGKNDFDHFQRPAEQ